MTRNTVIGLAAGVLVLAALACNFLLPEMSLDNLRLAYDSEGENPTDVFESEDVFFAVADLRNAPAGTVVEAKWLVVQIEGYDPGEVIFEQTLDDFTDENFSGTIFFQLSNDDPWPAGDYKVDVYLDGILVQSASFRVR